MDINKKKLDDLKKVDISKNIPLQNDDIDKAVAFKIEDDQAIVTSIGIGYFAEKIREEAQKHDIPIYQDKELTEKLLNFDINVPLPPSAYDLIVAFINFVSTIERDIYRKGENK